MTKDENLLYHPVHILFGNKIYVGRQGIVTQTGHGFLTVHLLDNQDSVHVRKWQVTPLEYSKDHEILEAAFTLVALKSDASDMVPYNTRRNC